MVYIENRLDSRMYFKSFIESTVTVFEHPLPDLESEKSHSQGTETYFRSSCSGKGFWIQAKEAGLSYANMKQNFFFLVEKTYFPVLYLILFYQFRVDLIH